MLTSTINFMKNRIVVPNSLAVIAAIGCLALAGIDYTHDASVAQVTTTEHPAAETEEAGNVKSSESKEYFHLPDLTFFLFPGNRAR